MDRRRALPMHYRMIASTPSRTIVALSPWMPFTLALLLLLLAVRPILSSFQSCDTWFERNVLCDSIDVQKEFSMIFQKKDLTYCPDRCQTCKNYDRLELNRTSFHNYYAYDKTLNQTCESIGYDGLCYGDEEEYHLYQQKLYIDNDGAYISIMPWEIKFFYNFAHCAKDLTKVQNIWKTGDSDDMYERIVQEFPEYSPTVLSRPEDSAYARVANDHETSVGVGPWLVQLENLLTDEECDAMIAQTKVAIDGSDFALLANDEEDEDGGACQSTQAWCDPDHCMKDAILQNAWQKIEELVGLPFDTHTEPVHFIQYVPGQKYGRHTDAIPEEYNSMAGPRIFTLLFYLNDIHEGNGGETCFPQIERSGGSDTSKICITPKKGRAVIWPNIRNELLDGTTEIPENRTYHEANSIQEGYKYAGTIWYHLRNVSYAESIDCTDMYTDPYNYDQLIYERDGMYDYDSYFNDDDDGYEEYDDDGQYDTKSYLYDDDP